MPELSRFLGIVITINFNEEGHNEPHIHVRYNNYEASISLEGKVLSGSLPVKQYKYVESWLDQHREAALEAWFKAQNHQQFEKIPPLER